MRKIYSNPSKEIFEDLMVKILKAAIDDFPRGDKDRPDPPDFIFRSANQIVGVEVIGIQNQNHTNNMPLKQIRDAQFRCLRKTKELLAEKREAPVEVKVKFRDDYIPIEIEKTAEELCDFVLQKASQIDDTNDWHYYESGLKQISWISIHLDTSFGKIWLDEHRVENLSIFYTNDTPYEIIQRAIDSKNKKLDNYLKECDECWLIVGVNEQSHAEAITVKEGDDSVYFSDFARTYFVSGVLRKVLLLNVAPSSTRS